MSSKLTLQFFHQFISNAYVNKIINKLAPHTYQTSSILHSCCTLRALETENKWYIKFVQMYEAGKTDPIQCHFLLGQTLSWLANNLCAPIQSCVLMWRYLGEGYLTVRRARLLIVQIELPAIGHIRKLNKRYRNQPENDINTIYTHSQNISLRFNLPFASITPLYLICLISRIRRNCFTLKWFAYFIERQFYLKSK